MKLILKHKNKTSRRAIYSLMLVLFFSISGYFHTKTKLHSMQNAKSYCPLYRAIFTSMIDTYHWKFKKLLPSISGYFHYINKLSEDVKFSFVIALYIGLFSLELFPIIVSTEKAVSCYCPLYRAIFTNFYMNYFHIRKQLLPSISGYFHNQKKMLLG